MPIWLIVIYFGCHIFICADFCAAHRFFNGLGYSKIAQFIVTIWRHKNILRLNIPMYDLMLFAQFQSCAHVFGYFDNRCFSAICGNSFGQWCQQLHFDKNVPADSVIMLNVSNIVTVNDIGTSIHFSHQRIFCDDTFQVAFECIGNTLIVIAIAIQLFNVAVILRNRDHFQCSFFNFTKDIALDFINCAKASSAN